MFGATDEPPELLQQAAQIEACVQAVGPPGNLDLIVGAEFVTSTQTIPLRRTLLELGHVTDLFDCGRHSYLGWLGSDHDVTDDTQVVQVPPPDQWPDFIQHLEDSWLLIWRWGDLAKLRPEEPWTPESIKPDRISMLLRLWDEMARLDTSVSLEASAYLHLRYIEVGLRYLMELQLGSEPNNFLGLMSPDNSAKLKKKLSQDSGAEIYDLVDLLHFKRAVDQGWAAFGPVFDPDGEIGKADVLKQLQAVNGIRNRVAHPTRLASSRLTQNDLAVLAKSTTTVRGAIARAETEAGLT